MWLQRVPCGGQPKEEVPRVALINCRQLLENAHPQRRMAVVVSLHRPLGLREPREPGAGRHHRHPRRGYRLLQRAHYRHARHWIIRLDSSLQPTVFTFFIFSCGRVFVS